MLAAQSGVGQDEELRKRCTGLILESEDYPGERVLHRSSVCSFSNLNGAMFQKNTADGKDVQPSAMN